jgi:hypothetical protein
MKRSHVVLSLVVLLVALALPGFARADADPAVSTSDVSALTTLVATPDGFTWDETAVSTADPAPDGFTWDETAAPADPTPQGLTWDESAPAAP